VLFRGTDWREAYDTIRGAKLGWLLLTQIPIWLSYFARIQRWSYIVRVGDPVSFRHMFSATHIGFLANFTLPLRIGEPIRALALSRLAGLRFTQSMAMVVLDRVTDLISLMPVLAVTLVTLPSIGRLELPPGTLRNTNPIVFRESYVTTGAWGAMAFLVAVIAVLVLLYVNQRLVLRVSEAVLSRVSEKVSSSVRVLLSHFAEGLHIFRSASDMVKSIAFSLATWGLTLVAWVCMLNAFELAWPWYTVFVMQSFLAAAISAPGLPGLLGQFHLPIVIALLVCVPDISPSGAKAVAIVAHLLSFIPITIAGLFCLVRERMGLWELTRETAHLQEEAPQDA